MSSPITIQNNNQRDAEGDSDNNSTNNNNKKDNKEEGHKKIEMNMHRRQLSSTRKLDIQLESTTSGDIFYTSDDNNDTNLDASLANYNTVTFKNDDNIGANTDTAYINTTANDAANRNRNSDHDDMNDVRRHRHHRSLSGLFSESASISGYSKQQQQPSQQQQSQMPARVNDKYDIQKDPKSRDNVQTSIASSYPCQQLTIKHPPPNMDDDNDDNEDVENDEGYAPSQLNEDSAGRKHRRMYSGGVSNPSMAHRRINSGGNAAFVSRNRYHPSTTSANNSNNGSVQYHYHPQHHDMNSRPRSLSPRPSPKHYSVEDVSRRRHCRDDSGIGNLLNLASISNQDGDNTDRTNANASASNINSLNSTTTSVEGGPMAAAQWLQNMRKSPPFDLSSVDYVDHYNPSNATPNPVYSHGGSLFPPPRHFGNRSTSVGDRNGSRNSSPTEFHGAYVTSHYPYPPQYCAGGERLPSPSASNYSHSSSHHHQQQYPMQQPQAHRENKPPPHYPEPRVPPANYYPNPLVNTAMRSSSSSASSSSSHQHPNQQQHQNHHHHDPYSHNHRSTYIAATHAARDATIGLPHHPLATGPQQRPLPLHQSSISSLESKIETDEPLFQKDVPRAPQRTSSTSSNISTSHGNYPPRPTPNFPHYRISPQLFEESLKEHSMRGSPTSLTYSASYQETLLSSLVDQHPISSSPPLQQQQHQHQHQQQQQQQQQQQHQHQHQQKVDQHHHKTSSGALLNEFVQDLDKQQPPQEQHSQPTKQTSIHQRVSSTGTLVLDDSLFGVKFLEPDIMQSTSSIPSTNANSSVSLNKMPPVQKQETFNSTITLCSPIAPGTKKSSTKPSSSNSSNITTGRKITGGVSKRVRRKCNVGDCPNRVVQGGLCIAHGAKRKICGHEGCTKHVKKAGMCSTHGPARKRCEIEGCQKVAVQGGKCIAHGAKKKLCSVKDCTKQAILSGMCKKHHDQEKLRNDGDVGTSAQYPSTRMYPQSVYCLPVGDNSKTIAKENEGNSPDISGVVGTVSKSTSASSHRRGLSIFQDMGTVNTIIGSSAASTPTAANDITSTASTNSSRGGEGPRGRNTHTRGLSIFADDEVVDKIVHNGL